ncbi:MAG TPA: hypothetical protein VNE40_00760 [Candidatus Dormibacteraeota bacterium]|nr:hypothetical protein [Candidatus Dormibacteraeota bacterium]
MNDESGMPYWEQQYQRMLSWAERIDKYYEGFEITTPLKARHIRDDLLSFFMNAHHIKDWIGNDPSNPITKREVQVKIDENSELVLCMDLCNGGKHLVYDDHRSAKDPSFGVGHLRANFGGENQGIALTSQEILLNDGSVLEAKELVEKIISQWDIVINDLGLQFTSPTIPT